METNKCQMSHYFSGSCGIFSKFPNETDLTKIGLCKRDVSYHRHRCRLTAEDANSEGKLLLRRAGFFFDFPGADDLTICPKHRYMEGLFNRQLKSCQHPNHTGKMRVSQAFSLKWSARLYREMKMLIPVGTGICRRCYDLEKKKDLNDEDENSKLETCMSNIIDPMVSDGIDTTIDLSQKETCLSNEIDATDSDGIDTTIDLSQKALSDKSDITQKMSQVSNWSEEEDLHTGLERVNEALQIISRGGVSPLRSQLRTDLDNVSESTRYYYKRKANESIDALLNLMAPEQSSQLKNILFENKTCKSTPNETLTNTIIKLYEETTDNSLKTQLLSLIANKFSKIELQRLIPGLTTYQIDRSRSASTSIKGLSITTNHKYRRQRMDQTKLQHALTFFLDPSFIQTVSYGIREILLDSGNKLEIPDVVRTVCNSKMVEMYIEYCREHNFVPLGRTSLFNILKACAASKRSNLRGLDNITASGIEGFDMLESMVYSLRDAGHLTHDLADEIQTNLSSAKLYFKTDYKLHVKESDSCADHCLNWSLSDPCNKDLQILCDHSHTLNCDRCEHFKNLQEQLVSVMNLLPSDMKEDVQKTLQDSVEQIKNWKAHIARTVNQDRFRIELLDKLKENEALLVMDWAMKFLPMKYRQTQSDWFGQRGINWHVTHNTYTHVLDGVKQDWYSVMSILEHTLLNVKHQLPQIEKVYLRSDNAGCYHNGHIWLCLPEVSKRTGINILQMCYSEAQAGKSYCDAKIAHMRQKIKMYVATGHDVCTAAEMKEALDSGKGVSGCQVAVIDIDDTFQVLKSHKIKNVTHYNDIRYKDGNIILLKAFDIGTGVRLHGNSLSDLSGGCAAETKPGYQVLSGFKMPSKKGKITVPKIKKTDNESVSESTQTNEETGIFTCPEIGCLLQFCAFSSLQEHLLVGKHSYALERESTYDCIKKQWASMCNEVSITRKAVISATTIENTNSTCMPMGWALKKNKSIRRFSQPVKDFLHKKFEEGQQTGKKANPNDVMREMRESRTPNGDRVFPLKECLTSSQINSYFSKLTFLKTKKKGKLEVDSEEINTDLVALLSALEEKTVIEQLQETGLI